MILRGKKIIALGDATASGGAIEECVKSAIFSVSECC